MDLKKSTGKHITLSLRLKIILFIVSIISLFSLFMNSGMQSIIRNNSHSSLENQVYRAARVSDRVIRDVARDQAQTIRVMAEQTELRQAVQNGNTLSLPPVLLTNFKKNNFSSLQIRSGKSLISYVGKSLSLPKNWRPSGNASSNIFQVEKFFYLVSTFPIWNSYYLVGIKSIDKRFIRDIQNTSGVNLMLFSSTNLSVAAPSISNISTLMSTPNAAYIADTLKGKSRVLFDDAHVLTYLYLPFRNLYGKIIGSQILVLSSPKTAQLRTESTTLILKLFLIGALIALFVGILFSTTILRPIRKLIQWSLHIQEEDYTHPIEIKSHDEIQELAETLNLMTSKIYNHNHHLEKLIADCTRELKDANQKLHTLDKMKNDFIANIAHDFRSPLTVILNRADLALKTQPNLNETLKKTLTTILSSSIKLKHSIDRLLDLAKMDAKGVQLHISQTNLSTLLSNLIDFYNSATIESNIKIQLHLPEFDVTNIFTDFEKLEQVLNNTLSNALKFIDPDTGRIDIFLRTQEKTVSIEIKDNGIGIDPTKLESIFNRFEQTEGGENSSYKGTGIGLAFSKQLIHFLKGDIRAHSKGANKGASFIITLPKGKEAFQKEDMAVGIHFSTDRETQKQLLQSDIREKQKSKAIVDLIVEKNAEGEYDPHKVVILIIDDNSEMREIAAQYLRIHGFKNFVLASDGKMGLDAIYQYHPDLIICDFNMPNMCGDELHNQISSNPNTQNIPFIFLSAMSNKKLTHERREKGAIAYLKKPIEETELVLTVRQHLNTYLKYQKINILATTDELTGLLNKREIMIRLNRELQMRKYRNLSLIFLDIDHFKKFNDTYGHQLGDKVLHQLGNIVQECLRSYDLAGRYGGEEFLIILPDTSLKNAQIVAEKLRTTIESRPVVHKGKNLTVTSSFGVSSLKDHATYIEQKLGVSSLESLFVILNESSEKPGYLSEKKQELISLLIEMADQALYTAKSTRCIDCGFASEKSVFKNSRCPKCQSSNLKPDRNQVKLFTPPN